MVENITMSMMIPTSASKTSKVDKKKHPQVSTTVFVSRCFSDAIFDVLAKRMFQVNYIIESLLFRMAILFSIQNDLKVTKNRYPSSFCIGIFLFFACQFLQIEKPSRYNA